MPLSLTLTGANCHDSTQLRSLIGTIQALARRRGRQRQRPQSFMPTRLITPSRLGTGCVPEASPHASPERVSSPLNNSGVTVGRSSGTLAWLNHPDIFDEKLMSFAYPYGESKKVVHSSYTPNPFDLTGRKALVTGGATGIGKGIALGLAASGADVALTLSQPPARGDACRDRGVGPAGRGGEGGFH